MDLTALRVAVTVLSFVAFIGIVIWAWSRRNRGRFDEAAQLPFVESRPRQSPAAERGDRTSSNGGAGRE